MVFEVVVWDGEATGSADLMDVDDDNAAGARDAVYFLSFDKVIEARRVLLDHPPVTKQSHDSGRSLESGQHDSHAVVARLVDVRYGFVAAAGKFLIPERLAVKHTEVLATFGRDIDVSIT